MKTRVVAAAILRGGRLLVAKRGPGGAHGGLWELPGGKVEPGETDAAALIREIEEELEVSIVVGEPLGATETEAIELVAYWAHTDGTPQATTHAALQWATASQLDGLQWPPADQPFLPSLKARLLD